MTYVLLIVGLVLLFFAGEGLVRGAVALARRIGVSALLIGLTVVAAGTSAPELVVTVNAGLSGSPDIAMGNIIGSNIANILLILGVAALIQPMRTTRGLVFRDGGVMLGASVLLAILAISGIIERWHGALMFIALIGYVAYSYRLEKTSPEAQKLREQEIEDTAGEDIGMVKAVLYLLAGLGGLVLGADLLVDSAVELARGWGVPERIIGLTLVAVGTSLPELATSTVAAVRGHGDVAVGNVIGSNIFNVLAILGISSMIVPIPVNPIILQFDIWFMLGISALLLVFLWTGWRLSRREAGLFLAGYVGYSGWLFAGGAL